MVISLDSTTAANVGRFLNETQFSERSDEPQNQHLRRPQISSLSPSHPSEFDFASSPQIDIQVHENSDFSDDSASAGAGAGADADDKNNNNKYKKMLRYVPNTGFHKETHTSTFNAASIPNTFKHKSHPNAQTKAHIGSHSVEELSKTSRHEHEDIHLDSGSEFQTGPYHIKTSTMRGDHADAPDLSLVGQFNKLNISGEHKEAHFPEVSDHSPTHNTPSWMPQGLEDKWEEASRQNTDDFRHYGNGHASQPQKNELVNKPSLDFFNTKSSTDTFVHKPLDSQGAPVTPMWKKMSQQYQNKVSPGRESPLKNIFQTIDESSEKPRQSPKPAPAGYMSMSTVSTPVATRDSDLHLTQHQIHQLEDMLEQAKDKPDDFQIKGSPLKLFGGEYDTFTKSVLSKFVDRVRSNANSVQRNPLPVVAELPVPKLKIKNFTKSGDYTDQDFMKNADNIFAHLQKKGYTADPSVDVPENSLLHQKSNYFTHSQTTATSTPKPQKVQAEIRRDVSDLYSYSSGSDAFHRHSPPNTTDGFNEYTEIDKTYLEKPGESHSKSTISENGQDNDSYTFDELSEFDSRSTEPSSAIRPSKREKSMSSVSGSPSPTSDSMGPEPLAMFESSMSSVKKFMKEEPALARPPAPKKRGQARSGPAAENPIRWRRTSQLRLLSESSNKANIASEPTTRYAKGTVKPGEFPGQYGDMVFDAAENRWVSNGKENDFGGSLDSIEDLVSDEPPSNIAASDFKRKRDKRQLEVSFQIPASDHSQTIDGHLPDVTNVSEFGNATFSQSNKELVSIITGSTDEIVWESITSIDLSDKKIDRVENLEQYLPAVKCIDLSKNKLQFVEGLPSALFELDVTKNNLSDMTSFAKFHDLQVVNASFNGFRTFSCLSQNINLSRINLMGNQIDSLESFPSIHSLTSLNISRNNISGKVRLDKLRLPNLKELIMSENSITSISGIEQLPNLRILNVNENRIASLECSGTHKRLKKLLCKFNELTRLNLESFPFLRILRIDGNALVSVTGLKKLKFLQELSAKSQSSQGIVETFSSVAADISSVDFSGNTSLVQLLPNCSVNAFFNVNILNLSAVGLSSLPADFGDKFFNVRELNLSFNKLGDLQGLANLKQLKKLQVVSNNLTKMESILTGLQSSRRTLKVLDLRLNFINFEFYPYVFSPEELDQARENKGAEYRESPIPIQSLEDIESFTILYNALNKSRDEWQARDNEFFTQMRKEGKDRRMKERLNYETILICFFLSLRELDGGVISGERRAALRENTISA